MKPNIIKFIGCLLLTVFLSISVQAKQFNKSTDLLLLQHDSNGDEDDIQSMAVEGCWLLHPDADGVHYWAVTGTIGRQPPNEILGHRDMMATVFGTNWSDAWKNWNTAVTEVKNQVRPYLDKGGTVWVAEAGQSDFTRDWCEALISEGVPASTILNHVIVVQHSAANEHATSNGQAPNIPSDLDWIRANTTYIKIADGNFTNSIGAGTPGFNSNSNTFRAEAIAPKNPNAAARAIMEEFERIILLDGTIHNPPINKGGIDFSDVVVLWHIMGWGSTADTNDKVWDRYITNTSGKAEDTTSTNGTTPNDANL